MSVRYNVATLLKEPVGSTRSYEVDDTVPVQENGAVEREHVTGHTDLLRTLEGVLVQAQLRAEQHDRCARCLRELDLPLELDIEEEFYPVVDIETGTPVKAADQPGAFRIDEHHILDLEEAIREYSMLAAPMQPLCRPDCRGLCPKCGLDLNEGACDCAPENDERWAALRQLLQSDEGS